MNAIGNFTVHLQQLFARQKCKRLRLAKVAKTGGIAAIIGALADHRDNSQMQYWGQIVLANLCFLDCKMQISEVGTKLPSSQVSFALENQCPTVSMTL